MKRTLVALCLLAIAGLSAGQEDPSDLRLERLRLARLAAEAKLKLGEVLLEKGDLPGAEREFREAAKILRDALGKPVPDEIVEEEPIRPAQAEEPEGKPAPGFDRGLPGRRRNLRAGGGTGLTETAVGLGLKWLADHQDLDGDGRWDCDDFAKHDPANDKCDGSGATLHDVGVTGLALLAFLGAGYTDRGAAQENPYARNVRAGLRHLIEVQDSDGVFGSRASQHFIYHHVIATAAMCEAYGMTRNPRYRRPAQEGVNWILHARNPYLGWRYGARSGENDTSVTSLCVVALRSAEMAGLEVDRNAYVGARQWFVKVTEPEFGQTGYNFRGGHSARPQGLQDQFPPEKTQAMTAAALFARILTGEDPKRDKTLAKSTSLILKRLPVWNTKDGSIDMYYWYFGTHAMFQVGGQAWKKWNEKLKEAVVESQHGKGSGSRTGSWDPAGVWGESGGRVYSTALMTMCMEVYYRYDRAIIGD